MPKKIGCGTRFLLQPGQHAGPIRFPVSSVSAASAFSGLNMTSNSIILQDPSNLASSMPPKWPVVDIGGKFQRGGVDAAAVQPLIYSPVLNVYSNGPTMKDDKAKRDGQIGSPAKDSRQSRLKLALRENLKRRKSQARGRSDAEGASPEEADASLDDAGGKEPGR